MGLEDADIVFVSVMEVESKGRKPLQTVGDGSKYVFLGDV